MSTLLANPADMIRQGAPHLIRSDEELDTYTDALLALDAIEDPSGEDIDAAELLAVLIERYEKTRYPIAPGSPLDVLRLLMDSHRLKQRDLCGELGSEANVSLILAGKRNLTVPHVFALARRFGVAPAVFLPAL